MKDKTVQKGFLPVTARIFILFVYFFSVFRLSAYILDQDTGEFFTLFLLNILFITSLILLIGVSGFADDVTHFLRILCRWIDTLNEWVGRIVAWVTFLVVIVVFVDVVMRYALRISFVFVQELEWHLFAFIFLMGAGFTLLKDGHVRVDIIYQRLGPKAQAWVNFIGVLFFLIPGCYMIIVTSSNFVYNSWSVLEGSPDPGGIPYRFILKSAIPAGFVLILLQGISLGIKNLFVILGKDMKEKPKSYHLERDCRS